MKPREEPERTGFTARMLKGEAICESVPLFTFGHHSAWRQDRQPLSEFVFNSLSAFGWLVVMAGRLCVESYFTRMEQRKRADYFNVKEFPNPEWVWADCFHGKQFVTRFVCGIRSRAEGDSRTGSDQKSGRSLQGLPDRRR